MRTFITRTLTCISMCTCGHREGEREREKQRKRDKQTDEHMQSNTEKVSE